MSSFSERVLIVNADDFGISPGVNRGIIAAHRDGLVTAASVMPNLPAAADALALAAGYPDLDLGLHLTLTAGRPLTPSERVPTLVDGDGRFFVLGAFLARLSAGVIRRDDLLRELSAQVVWASARGVQPTHVDSHHHVHIHPRLAVLVLDLAIRSHIQHVRCPAETADLDTLRGAAPRDAVRTLVISSFARRLRARLRRRGLRTTQSFRGIGLGLGFGTDDLVRTIHCLPLGETELMTHPGHPDAELVRLTTFAEGRDRELAALVSPAARGAVTAVGARLTSFREAAGLPPYT